MRQLGNFFLKSFGFFLRAMWNRSDFSLNACQLQIKLVALLVYTRSSITRIKAFSIQSWTISFRQALKLSHRKTSETPHVDPPPQKYVFTENVPSGKNIRNCSKWAGKPLFLLIRTLSTFWVRRIAILEISFFLFSGCWHSSSPGSQLVFLACMSEYLYLGL